MKKLLFLGGAPHQVTAIQTAINLGIYTIVVDNRPENPGHSIAHESIKDVSTLDKMRILSIAKEKQVDGVISFGSDVSMATQQYVSQELGFKCHNKECVSILTDKHRFRTFMMENGFLNNFFFSQFKIEEKDQIHQFLKNKQRPYVIKPTDSSGSKGVSVIEMNSNQDINEAIEAAFSFSPSKTIIIEKFIRKQGSQICGDGYFEDGKIVFVHYGDGQFHEGLHAPYGEIFPGSHTQEIYQRATAHIEDVLNTAKFWRGPFNIDMIIDQNGQPFIIELGPRSGGNFIPEATRLHTSVDCTEALVLSTINPDYKLKLENKSVNYPIVACYVIHQFYKVKFDQIIIDKKISDKVLQLNQYISKNSELGSFVNASNMAGIAILKFNSKEEVDYLWPQIPKYIKADGERL